MKILTKTLLATLAATLLLAGCGTTGEAEKENRVPCFIEWAKTNARFSFSIFVIIRNELVPS